MIAGPAITILAETGVKDREYGLASGLPNTSQQIGGALGLAVLATIATTRTNHLAASHHPIDQALTLGFHSAFLAAAGFVVLAIIAAASIGARHVRRSQIPQPARRPEPKPEPASTRHGNLRLINTVRLDDAREQLLQRRRVSRP